MIDDTEGEDWLFRRDNGVRRPVESLAGRASTASMTVLSPDVQLLYKSKGLRDKDIADFEAVRPYLSSDERTWLRTALNTVAPGQPLGLRPLRRGGARRLSLHCGVVGQTVRSQIGLTRARFRAFRQARGCTRSRGAVRVGVSRSNETHPYSNGCSVSGVSQHRYFVRRRAGCGASGSPKRASAQARVLTAADLNTAGLTPLGAENGLASRRPMK